jgi:hypothetical protein
VVDLKSACFTTDAQPGDDPGTVVLMIDDVDGAQHLWMPAAEAMALAAKLMVAAQGQMREPVVTSDDRPRRVRVTGRGTA